MHRLAAILVLAGIAVGTAIACSSESESAPTACIELAKKCVLDTECCTGNCMWQEDGAYCQQKFAPNPPCSKDGKGCTQNRHCCSEECVEGICKASINGSSGGGGGGCLDDNNACLIASECCSKICKLDPVSNKRFCGDATFDGGSSGSSGGGCGKVGDSCTLPAQCCTNICVAGRCQTS